MERPDDCTCSDGVVSPCPACAKEGFTESAVQSTDEDDGMIVEFEADALTAQILVLVAVTSGMSHAIGDLDYPLYATILVTSFLSTLALFYWMYKSIWPQINAGV